ncbi:MAG: hypothetical protein VCB07_09980 [Gammaproteobacteria bacterium]
MKHRFDLQRYGFIVFMARITRIVACFIDIIVMALHASLVYVIKMFKSNGQQFGIPHQRRPVQDHRHSNDTHNQDYPHIDSTHSRACSSARDPRSGVA